eukprot:7669086-Pyramimonas_sp.AAC.1
MSLPSHHWQSDWGGIRFIIPAQETCQYPWPTEDDRGQQSQPAKPQSGALGKAYSLPQIRATRTGSSE